MKSFDKINCIFLNREVQRKEKYEETLKIFIKKKIASNKIDLTYVD